MPNYAVTEQEFEITNDAIENALKELPVVNKFDTLIGVGATLTTLGAIKLKMSV